MMDDKLSIDVEMDSMMFSMLPPVSADIYRQKRELKKILVPIILPRKSKKIERILVTKIWHNMMNLDFAFAQ